SGEQRQVVPRERRFLSPRRPLTVKVQDEGGGPLPARLSVTDARGRFFAPDDAWIHADDLLIPERQRMETRYVHGGGEWRMAVPGHRRLPAWTRPGVDRRRAAAPRRGVPLQLLGAHRAARAAAADPARVQRVSLHRRGESLAE